MAIRKKKINFTHCRVDVHLFVSLQYKSCALNGRGCPSFAAPFVYIKNLRHRNHGGHPLAESFSLPKKGGRPCWEGILSDHLVSYDP